MKPLFALLSTLILLLISCTSVSDVTAQNGPPRVKDFDSYWFQSLAEITSYDLQQSRYGEIHRGTTTTIFVTEPFNKKKQVKSDNSEDPNNVSVLKLNQTRNFNTGIYPYSTMTSIFTPVNSSTMGSSIKLTNSVQEWCGQVFMQMNKNKSGYGINSFSYFESESDSKSSIKKVLLEDEIFNMIRINPEGLLTGEIDVFPAALYLRLSHKPVKVYNAIASIVDASFNGKSLSAYTLVYPELKRELKIYFDKQFPYSIEGWEDTYSGYSGKPLTTIATRKNQIRSAYWSKNSVQDSVLYNQLFDFK